MGLTKTEQILRVMTPKQARRYAMYLNGESLTNIAQKEGVTVYAITQTIKNAEKRANKRLKLFK